MVPVRPREVQGQAQAGRSTVQAGTTAERRSTLAAPEGEGAAPAQLLSQPQGQTAALSKLALSCTAESPG